MDTWVPTTSWTYGHTKGTYYKIPIPLVWWPCPANTPYSFAVLEELEVV